MAVKKVSERRAKIPRRWKNLSGATIQEMTLPKMVRRSNESTLVRD